LRRRIGKVINLPSCFERMDRRSAAVAVAVASYLALQLVADSLPDRAPAPAAAMEPALAPPAATSAPDWFEGTPGGDGSIALTAAAPIAKQPHSLTYRFCTS